MTKYFETLQKLRVTQGLCLTDLSPTLGTFVLVFISLVSVSSELYIGANFINMIPTCICTAVW